MANRTDTISLAAADISGLKSAAQRDVGTSSGNVMEVGAFGAGTTNLSTINQEQRLGTGTYRVKMLLGGIDDNATVQLIPFDGNTVYQLIIPTVVGAAPTMYLRLLSGDSSLNGRLCKMYTDANTTRAADGTLKAASPIVKIFADGTAETNDESEGVNVTRQGEGVYLISGCLGLNADAAWGGIDGGFDIPKDRNRQPLIWLDYKVNPDGSVLVKTYHRTHPGAPEFAHNEREGFNEGDPIDIPADQFVSVRVEMPADSVYNKKLEEAARIQAERDEARRLEEEEAARVKAEQERLEAEAAANSDEQPDVQQ